MSFNWTRLATPLAMAGALAMVASGCVMHARARPATVVDESPPEPRYRDPEPRDGYVWIRGRWIHRNGDWQWKEGRWERERSGKTYKHGRWERRGGRYHWVEGRWVSRDRATARSSRGERDGPKVRDHRNERERSRTRKRADSDGPKVRDHRSDDSSSRSRKRRSDNAGPKKRDHRSGGAGPKKRDHRSKKYPTSAPPSPKNEDPGNRSGYVWIPGRYVWKSGEWEWQDGHWERKRSGKTWKSGRWKKQGDRYVWVEGKWVDEGRSRDRGGPKTRDHRRRR